MKQAERKKKIAKMDPHQRLAMARKQAALESHRSPVVPPSDRTSVEASRPFQQYTTIEIGGGVGAFSDGEFTYSG